MKVTEGTTLETDRPAPEGQGQVLVAVASLLGCGALLGHAAKINAMYRSNECRLRALRRQR